MTNDDYVLKQQENTKIVQDTIILQKVNRAHREAFRTKFPGQVEHCLRLAAERLHAVLLKKPQDLSDPNTWHTPTEDIQNLTNVVYLLAEIHQWYPVKEQQNESNT